MIEAFTGYPGHGKTFACTYRAYQDIKRGYKVFTNYPVKGAYQITFDDLCNYTFPQGSTVIIDESGRWFNSRNWAKLPPAVFDLFTLHRHFKLDLIVAVQNFNRIDVALREVIELVWWARNYSFLPFFIYDGYYDVDKLGMKGESQKRMYIPKLTKARKLYDTHIMRRIAEEKTDIPLIPWQVPRIGVSAALADRGSPAGVEESASASEEPADHQLIESKPEGETPPSKTKIFTPAGTIAKAVRALATKKNTD